MVKRCGGGGLGYSQVPLLIELVVRAMSANPIVLQFHWQSTRARCSRFQPCTDTDELLPEPNRGFTSLPGIFCDRAQTSALLLPHPTTSEPSPLSPFTSFGVVSLCGIYFKHWGTMGTVWPL
ncbi:hypothetical protein DPMN_061642 [Dreissena polymorpha]|uniref:Uncharacterized protein n=1 Tax=Dreissena polymorpha TaxID=45954 RepID=A0A9D4C7T9_DREPO|nr:hypothetical protein DPMN_061642 [Dreissena polymorpha]